VGGRAGGDAGQQVGGRDLPVVGQEHRTPGAQRRLLGIGQLLGGRHGSLCAASARTDRPAAARGPPNRSPPRWSLAPPAAAGADTRPVSALPPEDEKTTWI